MAGLPSAGARVGVGPPLAASGPSSGLAAVRSVGLANAHETPVSRLYPADSCGATPAQLGPGAEAAPARGRTGALRSLVPEARWAALCARRRRLPGSVHGEHRHGGDG